MTLYNQFGSKEELVAAWLRRRDAEWAAWLERSVTGRGGGVLAVFDALRDWFAQPGFRGCAFLNTLAELGGSSPLATGLVVAHKRALRDYLTRLAAAEGVRDPEFAGSQLLLLVDGATVGAAVDGDPRAADAAREAAARLLAAAC
jgi:AcrR family transcriptional regulator